MSLDTPLLIGLDGSGFLPADSRVERFAVSIRQRTVDHHHDHRHDLEIRERNSLSLSLSLSKLVVRGRAWSRYRDALLIERSIEKLCIRSIHTHTHICICIYRERERVSGKKLSEKLVENGRKGSLGRENLPGFTVFDDDNNNNRGRITKSAAKEQRIHSPSPPPPLPLPLGSRRGG